MSLNKKIILIDIRNDTECMEKYLISNNKLISIYNIPMNHIAFNKKWEASLSGRYISSRYDVGGYATPDVKLDYYTLLNAHVQYQASKRLYFYIDMQNILQDRFQEIYGYNTIGRTIQFGFRFNYSK